MELCKAAQVIGDAERYPYCHPDVNMVEDIAIKRQLELIFRTLYADKIPAYEGGDGKFFNFRELTEAVMSVTPEA